jgi:nucleoside-diphosphate-sugar epimerase
VRELGAAVARELGRYDLGRFGARPAPAHDVDTLIGDPEHAVRTLGWRAEISLAAGISDTVEWGRVAFGSPRNSILSTSIKAQEKND